MDQMKLQRLVELSLLLIMASSSKGQEWDVNVTRRINAELGSNVTIPCTFTYPTQYHTDKVQLYWKMPVKSTFKTYDKDPNAFVFHPNDTFVVEKYRGKTKLIHSGEDRGRNCSLKIVKIMDSQPNIYLRIIAKGNNYSFRAKPVSIIVSGQGVTPVTLATDIGPPTSPVPTSEGKETPGRQTTLSMYIGIIVGAAVLITIGVVGIVHCRRRRRSQSLSREESGYYINFSRATSNQAPKSDYCEKPLPEAKDINEPVYINLTHPTLPEDQQTDHTDNVYGNMDYSQ